MLGRGKQSEIGLYIDNFLNSELQSNIIELCPVGALTSKVYNFRYRSWDVNYNESIDITDSLCSPIRIFIQSNKILRVLPQYDDFLNFNFLTEKARFIYDSLNIQRLDTPIIKSSSLYFSNNYILNKFLSVSWENLNKILFKFYLNLFNNNKNNYWNNKNIILFKPILGNLVDLELVFLIKNLSLKTESIIFNNTDNLLFSSFYEIGINYDNRSQYIFNLFGFNKFNLCLLLNLNLRLENPLLNSKLRQEYVWNNFLIYSFGNKYNLTYKYFQLSNSQLDFKKFIEGRFFLTNLFSKIKYKPFILYSSNLLQNINNKFFYKAFNFIKKFNLNIVNQYICNSSARTGTVDLV
jgi:NADH dehydrogenase (ubiquinone) Fe-S protein 1